VRSGVALFTSAFRDTVTLISTLRVKRRGSRAGPAA
jgi:hypothetical protein